MMKRILISLAIIATARYAAADPTKELEAGNTLYQKKEFEAAIQSYQKVLASGHTAPEVEFNLGNALYKTGRNAEAILHYERAARMAPNDGEIAYNLKIAALKNTDRIEVIPVIFYLRWMNRISASMNEKQWGWMTICLTWLTFLAFVIYFLSTGKTKRFSFFTAFTMTIVASGAYWLGSERKSIEFSSDRAVVMSNSVYVKSSPDDKGNDLFILHDGTTVQVTDALGEWKKIRIANGASGWLPAGSIEII